MKRMMYGQLKGRGRHTIDHIESPFCSLGRPCQPKLERHRLIEVPLATYDTDVVDALLDGMYIINMTGAVYQQAERGKPEVLPWCVIQPVNRSWEWLVVAAIK